MGRRDTARAYGSFALANGILFVGGDDERLYALDAATGSEVWSFLTDGPIQTSAAVWAGIVYVASEDPYGDAYLYALDRQSGDLLWRKRMDNDGPVSSPAIAKGVVFVSANGVVRAFRASDGKALWRTPIAETAGSPIVANGVVYVAGGLDGTFHALAAVTGTPLWSFTAGGAFSDPIVANGVVYAGSLDRNLYAFALPG